MKITALISAFARTILHTLWPPHTGRRVKRKASRVRPYAPLPQVVALTPAPSTRVSLVDVAALEPQADMVRGYYRAHERRRELDRADQSHLDSTVFSDMAVPA
ncbi:hypothetical protein [Nocardiopsis sp. FIRDI 009]|uniref:hypothetical protein n=1 Tax=Nocardiopsis sp. FIRDI 009 TaxID=714197 RepID=UPI000E23F374|nr:hypothetical protein [Nocardiopsis sp. FIRDI 009]